LRYFSQTNFIESSRQQQQQQVSQLSQYLCSKCGILLKKIEEGDFTILEQKIELSDTRVSKYQTKRAVAEKEQQLPHIKNIKEGVSSSLEIVGIQ
jgi:hypothetical protein